MSNNVQARSGVAVKCVLLLCLVAPGPLLAQAAPTDSPSAARPLEGQTPPASGQSSPAVAPTSPSSVFKIRLRENLVLVRVTVRDSKNNDVRGLRQQDFRLFDGRNEQKITYFDKEDSAVPAPGPPQASDGAGQRPPDAAAPAGPVFPDRYVAFFFDDIHGGVSDLTNTQRAVGRYLARGIAPADRFAVVTSSGKVWLDFTADRDALARALGSLKPSPVVNFAPSKCPDIPDLMAYRMVQLSDSQARELARAEIVQCARDSAGPPPNNPLALENQANAAAEVALDRAKRESLDTLDALDRVIAHTGAMPGQRSVVVVSPGFLTMATPERVDRLADEALHLNVRLNAVDSKGLVNDIAVADASTSTASLLTTIGDTAGEYQSMVTDTRLEHENVMVLAAAATGGRFFHNSNDFDLAVRETIEAPQVVYTLAFAPHDVKYDGSFHKLRVEVLGQSHVTVEARRGYFAPAAAPDPAKQEQGDIEQALTSNDEVNDVPARVAVQAFKVNGTTARLRVVTHLDLQFLDMRRDNGLNVNHLRMAALILDQNGFQVERQEKNLDLRLPDEKLAELRKTGLTVEITFDLKPGPYTVREVFRDANGALSATSRHVNLTL
jgi:VWFA-related protein